MLYYKTSNKLVVWQKDDGTCYYKIIKGHYSDYHIGYKNSYGHRVVLIIENLEYRVVKTPYKKRLKRKLIDYINRNL